MAAFAALVGSKKELADDAAAEKDPLDRSKHEKAIASWRSQFQQASANSKKNAALTSLRKARRRLASYFTLTADEWQQWLSDEQSMDPDNAATTHLNDFYDLYTKINRGHPSCISMWIKRASATETPDQMIEVLQLGIASEGCHYQNGHALYGALRDAIQLKVEGDVEPTDEDLEKVDREIRRVWKEQLSHPQKNWTEQYNEYEEWDVADGEDRLEMREPKLQKLCEEYEERIFAGGDHGKWKEYAFTVSDSDANFGLYLCHRALHHAESLPKENDKDWLQQAAIQYMLTICMKHLHDVMSNRDDFDALVQRVQTRATGKDTTLLPSLAWLVASAMQSSSAAAQHYDEKLRAVVNLATRQLAKAAETPTAGTAASNLLEVALAAKSVLALDDALVAAFKAAADHFDHQSQYHRVAEVLVDLHRWSGPDSPAAAAYHQQLVELLSKVSSPMQLEYITRCCYSTISHPIDRLAIVTKVRSKEREIAKEKASRPTKQEDTAEQHAVDGERPAKKQRFEPNARDGRVDSHAPPKEPRNETLTVFVTRVPTSGAEGIIQEIFSDCDVKSVECLATKKNPDVSFAFVELVNPEGFQKALTKSGAIPGSEGKKTIHVKAFAKKEERGPDAAHQPRHKPSATAASTADGKPKPKAFFSSLLS